MKKCLFIIISSLFLFNISLHASEVVEIETAGTFPVTFSYVDEETGDTVTKTVYITVEKPGTIINEIVGEGIDAEDVIVERNQLLTLTDTQWIKLAKAHAWNLNDGSAIKISKVLLEPISEEAGLFRLTFMTEKQTSVTVHVLGETEESIVMKEQYMNNTDIFQIVYEWKNYFMLVIFLLFILMVLLYVYIYRKVQYTEKLLYNQEIENFHKKI